MGTVVDYSEDEAHKMLCSTTPERSSIKRVSGWIIKNLDYQLNIARVWEFEILNASTDEKKLALLKVIDEVFQKSKVEFNPDLTWTFILTFSNIFAHMGNECNNLSILKGVDNILQTWGARRYFTREKVALYRELLAYKIKVLQSSQSTQELPATISALSLSSESSTSSIVKKQLPDDIVEAITKINEPINEDDFIRTPEEIEPKEEEDDMVVEEEENPPVTITDITETKKKKKFRKKKIVKGTQKELLNEDIQKDGSLKAGSVEEIFFRGYIKKDSSKEVLEEDFSIENFVKGSSIKVDDQKLAVVKEGSIKNTSKTDVSLKDNLIKEISVKESSTIQISQKGSSTKVATSIKSISSNRAATTNKSTYSTKIVSLKKEF